MKKLTFGLLICMLTLLTTNVFAQGLSQSIDQELTQLLEKDDLLPQDIQWEMTSDHISSVSGVHHGYYSQMVNGIRVYGTESSIHLTSNGNILAADNRFINKTAQKLSTTSPSLNAIQAVQAAASQLNYTISEALSVLESNGGPSQETLLSGGGMSLSSIPVKLMFQLTASDELVLVWDLSIQERNQQNWWNVRVDANTGTIIDKNDYMVNCSFEHDHSADSELNYNKNLFDIPNY